MTNCNCYPWQPTCKACEDKIMQPKIVYILAGNHKEASDYHSKHFPQARMCYVDSTNKVMGLRYIKLYVLDNAAQNPNYIDIIELARTREFEIIGEK